MAQAQQPQILNRSPWQLGPIPARRLERNGKIQYISNLAAPIMITDAVLKFFPESAEGPVFVIEPRYSGRVENSTDGS